MKFKNKDVFWYQITIEVAIFLSQLAVSVVSKWLASLKHCSSKVVNKRLLLIFAIISCRLVILM